MGVPKIHVNRRHARVVGAGLSVLMLVTITLSTSRAVSDGVPPTISGSVFDPLQGVQTATSVGVAKAFGTLLNRAPLNKKTAVLVEDADTHQILFSQNSDELLAPASTIKLLTALTALKVLGSQTRFTTSVFQTNDVLTLVGGGDPTLVSAEPKHWRGKPAGVERPPSLDRLADYVAQAVTDRSHNYILNFDSSFFSGETTAKSWPSEYVSTGVVSPVTGLTVDFGVTKKDVPYGDTGSWAATYLTKALLQRGVLVTVGKRSDSSNVGEQIAQVQSAPVSGIVERMLTTSNNTMAEFLAHHVGKIQGHTSFDAIAQSQVNVLSSLGVDMTGSRLHDASGLSRDDRVSANTVMSALRVTSQQLDTHWFSTTGLPIAGVSGTLKDRYPTGNPGRGYVAAKTGTLTGIASLAGFVVDTDGQVLNFVFIANNASSGLELTQALDRLATALATCGCQ